MKQVGVRELKAKLSFYLREIAAGEFIEVTDRGRVVAELRPPGAGLNKNKYELRFEQMVREGKIRQASKAPSPDAFKSSVRLPPGTAQQLVDDIRTERHVPGD